MTLHIALALCDMSSRLGLINPGKDGAEVSTVNNSSTIKELPINERREGIPFE
jgi:hypothetical protein